MTIVQFDTPHRPHRNTDALLEALKASLAIATRPMQPACFNRGDQVLYRGGWGRGAPQKGTIIWAGIMDYGYAVGEPVYDVRLESGETRWGYADQFAPLSVEAAK